MKVPLALTKDENIRHFSLAGSILALHTELRTLTALALHCGPAMVMQEQFTDGELSVLLPLLEMFPYYCPYEVLHASFYTGRTSEKAVEQSRTQLLQAQQQGQWTQEIRPVRDVLSHTRLKLRPFGIEISSIHATGYVLLVPSAPMPIRKRGDLGYVS